MTIAQSSKSPHGKLAIIIRCMNENHVSAVTRVHKDAFSGYMNVRLGAYYLRSFLLWFVERPFGVALIAEMNHEILGYVIGAPVGYNKILIRDLWLIAGCSIAIRPYLLMERRLRRNLSQRLRAIFGRRGSVPDDVAPQLPEPTMALVGIATSNDCRGQGVGTALINAFEEEALQRGMAAYRLSVYRSNMRARRFYESKGMICYDAGHKDYVNYAKLLFSTVG